MDAYRGDSNSGTERMWSFCISSIVPIVKEFALESAKLKNIDKNIEALTDKTINFFRQEYTYVQETKFSLVAETFEQKHHILQYVLQKGRLTFEDNLWYWADTYNQLPNKITQLKY